MQHKNARENGKAATCRKMQEMRDKRIALSLTPDTRMADTAAICCNLPRYEGMIPMVKNSCDTVRVTTTLTRQQHASLEHIAEQNGVKVAWLVRRAVENLIEQAQGPLFSLDLRQGQKNA